MKYLLLILLLPFSLRGQACRQLEQMTGQTIGCGHSSNTETQTNYYTPTQAEYNASFTKEYKRLALDENEKGLKKLRAGDYKAADRLFKSALDYDPNNQGIKNNLKQAQQNISFLQQTKPQEHDLKPNQQEFLKNIETDKKGYKSQMERINSRLASYVPPPSNQWLRKTVTDGMMLGTTRTLEDFRRENLIHPKKIPFTGENYPEHLVFAGTDNNGIRDFARAILDNLTVGDYTLSTEYGKKLINDLQGTQFKRLVAHSNGATVTEALIRRGVIQVDELHIVGGDRSLSNFEGYEELIKKYGVKKIVIWVDPNDPVPFVSSIPKLVDPEYKNLMDQYMKHTWNGKTDSNISLKFVNSNCNSTFCTEAHYEENYNKGMHKTLQNSNPRPR